MYNNIYLNDNANKTFQTFVAADNKGGTSSAPNRDTNPNLNQNLQQDTYEKPIAKEKKKRNYLNNLIKMGTTATVIGLIFTAMIKGHSQKISKKIQSVFGGVESKLANVKDKHLHKILTTSFGVLEKFAKIITNSSSQKDYSVHKALGLTKITTKFRDFISVFFTNENKNSVLKSFKQSRESHNDFITSVEEAIKKSEENPALIIDHSKFKRMKELFTRAKAVPDFITGKEPFEDTCKEMNEAMDFLAEKITLKRLFSKEIFQGFIAENILLERRAKYAKRLFGSKNAISCSFEDLSEYAKGRIADTNLLIYSIKDAKLQQKLRDASLRLEESLKSALKSSASGKSLPEHKTLVKENIANLEREVEQLASSDAKDKLMVHINEYKNLFEGDTPGILQDIRILAADVWGDKSKFDLNIKEKGTQYGKDLNLSLTRVINMFDKQRDITLGSAPADVVGWTIPIVGFGLALNQSDTNDQKIEKSLELGIPLLGGLAVYYRSLKLQINGVGALTTSFGTAFLLNYIGSLAYKEYRKMNEAKKNESIPTPQQP